MSKKICSVEELKKESINGARFFILLNYGIRSSKYIRWDPLMKTFGIVNHVDDTSQHLHEEEIMDKNLTNIGEAIKKGAFFKVST